VPKYESISASSSACVLGAALTTAALGARAAAGLAAAGLAAAADLLLAAGLAEALEAP
jgi:hypothetical protein